MGDVRASLLILAIIILLLPASALQAAAPAAGTVIKNQASASYRACLDDNCAQLAEMQRVTSNLVETLIQAVPGIELVSNQTRPGQPGGVAYFPHTLTNTGNGRDDYALCIDNEHANIDSWTVYPDANGDGQPDAGAASLFTDGDPDGCWDSHTPDLLAGETFALVVEAQVSATALVGQMLTLDVQATSNSNALLSASNTDTINLIDGPVLELVKSLSLSEGHSPSGPLTVTLTYRNPSNQIATSVVIEDILPTVSVDGVSAGMSYVPGSARWSVTGNTVLTDDDDGGQGSAPDLIDFCAYDLAASNTDCHDRVRAELDQLLPGAQGTLTFEVNIEPGLAAGDRVRNLASVAYDNQAGDASFGPFDSNTVNYRIIAHALAPAVVANNDTGDSQAGEDDSNNAGNRVEMPAIGQGGVVQFVNVIWNLGDGEDSFDILIDATNDRLGSPLGNPFPAGTGFLLLKGDGATPLVDTTGNGVVDTGPIPVPVAGSCPASFVHDSTQQRCGLRVVLQTTLPPDATGGPFEVTKIARSTLDAQVSNAATDVLLGITSNSVDVTNDTPVNGSAPGEGAGPEGAPVQTLSIAPGNSGVLTLVINNTGVSQDNYALAVSDSLPFVANQLPAGWQVEFFQDGGGADCSSLGAAMVQTGLIPAGGHRLVCAQVSVPAGAVGGVAESLYFRALSPTSGASDIKHDAVMVAQGPALSLTPDQTGQVAPGNTVTYTHQLANTGNVPLTNVLLSGEPDASLDDGWSVVLYEDSNNDGVWDPADTLIQTGVPLADLAVNETRTVFAKVFAPATAAYGITNVKTLTATAEGASLPVTASATDTTTTSNTNVAVTKEQALDADCDGIADGPDSCTGAGCFVFTRFVVEPGQCVMYRLTATNTGAQPMHNVLIHDRTQPYTTYYSDSESCVSPLGCASVNTPADGATGDVTGDAGLLGAGENAVLIFGLRVE
ncbi:hypothetical protein [Alcanivorax sp.]|uniref:COG1470 family protein n=1 Tax=Alcanivorax sp. TaxID=1872427 RepID=UPI000C0EF8F8|nr:hypothetical protein [Alcanivorax sp.]PHR64113.1 MAG: hypothetical protein COA55_14665 [Alcanivorax sp.]